MEQLKQACNDAKAALWKAADVVLPTHFEPYQVGDQVWLEGKNLNTTHPSVKLAPQRYGPFRVM
jgi:hypothetical protein